MPEKADGKRKPPPKSRGESIGDGPMAAMPEIDGGEYLIAILFDVGPVTNGGFGAVAITELELLAWQTNRGVSLAPWECEMIRKLSREYAVMLGEATDPYCPAPYSEEVTVVDQKALKAKFAAAAAARRQ